MSNLDVSEHRGVYYKNSWKDRNFWLFVCSLREYKERYEEGFLVFFHVVKKWFRLDSEWFPFGEKTGYLILNYKSFGSLTLLHNK